jgi:hypothetical protein
MSVQQIVASVPQLHLGEPSVFMHGQVVGCEGMPHAVVGPRHLRGVFPDIIQVVTPCLSFGYDGALVSMVRPQPFHEIGLHFYMTNRSLLGDGRRDGALLILKMCSPPSGPPLTSHYHENSIRR